MWGDRGMQKLWSASNIKVYGGNVDENDFLDARSVVIVDYDRVRASTSRDGALLGDGRRNVSTQVQKERLIPVADLAALPPRPRDHFQRRESSHDGDDGAVEANQVRREDPRLDHGTRSSTGRDHLGCGA